MRAIFAAISPPRMISASKPNPIPSNISDAAKAMARGTRSGRRPARRAAAKATTVSKVIPAEVALFPATPSGLAVSPSVVPNVPGANVAVAYKLNSLNKAEPEVGTGYSNDPMNTCDPLGFPRNTVFETRGLAFGTMGPDRIVVLHQYQRIWRYVWMDGQHQLPTKPPWVAYVARGGRLLPLSAWPITGEVLTIFCPTTPAKPAKAPPSTPTAPVADIVPMVTVPFSYALDEFKIVKGSATFDDT